MSWGSRKQPTVALSTSEAEYVALTLASQEAIWLKHLLSDLTKLPVEKIVIKEDSNLFNQEPAISWSK